MPTTIEVRAKDAGYNNGRIRAGQTFGMSFSEPPAKLGDFPSWVTPVDWSPEEVKEPEAPPPTDNEIISAANSLDPDNDDHWTSKGAPAMAAIEAILGTDVVTRADLKRLVPDLTKEAAKTAQSSGDGGHNPDGGQG